ncbi:hypothetical protein HPB49_019687 [Dermacentor silvarum]|uniref:Uncharacterized protein n=1 Tax=Dermacentor silvarum TaxID=543639 RepID=A0ACB8CZ97_DERSI|nr:hypothetical protein HPB49_019687 [Dermacentor silvarum]
MDTTITRKRSRPSELGSDDEGASRKVQAVGTAPHNASTTKLPPHVTREDDRHFTLASGITTEGEFQQVLSKAQKRRQRSALPPGLAGNIPSPGTEPAVAPAARPTAPCSSPAPIAPPDEDPVVTAGVPRTSVPTSPLTSRTVLFRPAHNGAAFPRTSRLAIAQALSALPGHFPEQQSGFRCQRCTADSISDVVATLEDAKATGDVAMLVLLDVKSAFDGLPHVVIEACLDRLGLSGCLRRFISAFLTGRTFRVRVGQELSEPRDIMTGVPQGSVLSPFLFNMALAGLPASLPAHPRFPVRCSIYADDVALWTRGPRKFMPSIRGSLQRALDAVTAFLGSIGLTVSTAKTEAMLIHPLASARRYTKQLKIAGRALPWQQMGRVRYFISLPMHNNDYPGTVMSEARRLEPGGDAVPNDHNDAQQPMWVQGSVREEKENLLISFFVAALVLLMVIVAILAITLWSSMAHGIFYSFDDDETSPDVSAVLNQGGVASASPTTDAIEGKSLLVGSLLCTLRYGFSRDTFVFPADGVCGITTFNSFFTTGGHKLGPPYQPDLKYFLETAHQHRETEYGIGIDHE